MTYYPTYSRRPQPPKRRSKKKLIAVLGVLLILVPSVLYVYGALYKSPPTVSAAVPQLAEAPPAQPEITWPSVGQAAIGSVEEGVLASSSKNEQVRPTASMAKVVTALALMKKKPFAAGQPGATLTLDDQDVQYYKDYLAKDGSVALVASGETITQYQAIQAMLLPSANNMAESLARWGFGSVEEYNTYAASMLKEMGLTKTVITDPSGFDPGTVSTPSELVVIGRKAMQDPVIASIVVQQSATIPVAGEIHNTNRLLTDTSVVGIKTGTTDEAGACLLFASKYSIDKDHEVTIVGVIMGSTNANTLFPAAKALIANASKGFGATTLRPAGAVIASVNAVWGSKTAIVTKDPLIVYGWKGTSVQSVPTITDLTAPKPAGTVVGSLAASGQPDVKTDLILQDDLTAPTAQWRLTHYFN